MTTPTRDRILAAIGSFRPVAVEIPALGGTVHVRPLSLAGMARFQAAKDEGRAPAIMILDCLCDEHGRRLLTDADEAALADLPSAVAQTLVEAITAASALTAEATEDAAGKSPATH